MLLTALGYSSAIEKFTGSGWTLNVAKVANGIGLTKGNDEFGGNSEVTREEACLYALNMLKATEVTYDGTTVSVTTGDAQVIVGSQKAYKVENLGDSDGNIKDDDKMQFAEEHFPALKITNTNDEDDFGRPSNTWSYKNVSFGTFAKQPTFTYTSGVGSYKDNSENEDAKALRLKGYVFATKNETTKTEDGKTTTTVVPAVTAVTNGVENAKSTTAGDPEGVPYNKDGFQIDTLKELASLTGNGRIVEVYTDEDTADLITDVVVINSQLMQINRVNSTAKTVSLKKVDEFGKTIVTVDDDNDYYTTLASMKADDYVVITPVMGDDGYEVAGVYKPTTDSGLLTKVSLSSSGATNGITLNGTAYKLAANKGECFVGLKATNTVVNAKKDSTVYLDKYGYAMYIKDVDATTDYLIYSGTYSTLVDGKIIHMVQGYDLEGNAVSLNVGTKLAAGANGQATTENQGTLLAYTTTGAVNDGEYLVDTPNTAKTETVDGKVVALEYVDTYTGKLDAGASKIPDITAYFASGVKFVYVSKDGFDVDSVSVKSGVQKVSESTTMQYVVNDDGYVTYVIVDGEAEDATGATVAYVSALTGTTKVGNKAAYVTPCRLTVPRPRASFPPRVT